MIKLMTGRHVLRLFPSEHINEVLILLWDNFVKSSASSVGRGSECRVDMGVGWLPMAHKALMSR